MELKEMIKVMQHYDNGGEVEFSVDNFEIVLGEYKMADDGDLCWNWDEYDYRIKKPKVVIEKWLCRDKDGNFIVIEISPIDEFEHYEKVKLIKTYQVEL